MEAVPYEEERRNLLRLSRAEYERMAEEGYFGERRVELLEGLVYEMSPPGPPHAWSITRVTDALWGARKYAELRVQQPLCVSDDSEPEPDLALVVPADYRYEHPTTAFLVVEVSNTSLRIDRKIKGRVYARAGIPEYWIVNVHDGAVEIYTNPGDEGYATKREVTRGDVVTPGAFPELRVVIAHLLP